MNLDFQRTYFITGLSCDVLPAVYIASLTVDRRQGAEADEEHSRQGVVRKGAVTILHACIPHGVHGRHRR